jgi:hypothetical protein
MERETSEDRRRRYAKPFCVAGDSGPGPTGTAAGKKRSDHRQASSLFTDRLFG